MKTLFYRLFALFFRLGRLRSPRKSRVVFLAPHRGEADDSLSAVRRALAAEGRWEIFSISTAALQPEPRHPLRSLCAALRFFTVDAVRLATANYVYLNDNFMPLADLTFAPETVVTQLWHAEGAFKKFGLDAPLTPAVRNRQQRCAERYTYVVCSSAAVARLYAGAFGVPEEKVLPLGAPRADTLLAPCDPAELRRAFDAAHPDCAGKRLLLYAPTFRDDPAANAALPTAIDAAALQAACPDCRLLLRLHPQIHAAAMGSAVDVTQEKLTDLLRICDTVITDYSSVCMDAALLGKPCVFYAFDLDAYQRERAFYFDYASYVPGPVVQTQDALFDAIKTPRTDAEQLHRFRAFNFDYLDTENTKRVLAGTMRV
ncbi:MAG: CDP-glycerol glycerophosphotransferase family protein [Clostridia bacterium]|nr:CDP-glycerol glycerophosphotransferase family protein [Clostridia bacterium]